MWGSDGQTYNTPYPHYWIIVSRDEIGWANPGEKFGKPPLLVVPLNSYVEGETPVGPSDILINEESKIPFPLPTGKPTIVRCGQLRACPRRKKIAAYNGPGVSDELLAEIDKKLVEVLGLEEYIESRIKQALTNRV